MILWRIYFHFADHIAFKGTLLRKVQKHQIETANASEAITSEAMLQSIRLQTHQNKNTQLLSHSEKMAVGFELEL
jgi:hypothetical protein